MFDGAGGGVQQGRVFQQCEVGGEDLFFVDGLALAGEVQSGADFVAHLLKRRIQPLQLLVGAMLGGIVWQLDPAQAEQRPADQARRRA